MRPFTENVTLLIKMHGIFSTEKKVKQKPVPYKHQDVTVYRRRFAAFNGKKVVTQEPLPYTGLLTGCAGAGPHNHAQSAKSRTILKNFLKI